MGIARPVISRSRLQGNIGRCGVGARPLLEAGAGRATGPQTIGPQRWRQIVLKRRSAITRCAMNNESARDRLAELFSLAIANENRAYSRVMLRGEAEWLLVVARLN